jgi:hypothetical protein
MRILLYSLLLVLFAVNASARWWTSTYRDYVGEFSFNKSCAYNKEPSYSDIGIITGYEEKPNFVMPEFTVYSPPDKAGGEWIKTEKTFSPFNTDTLQHWEVKGDIFFRGGDYEGIFDIFPFYCGRTKGYIKVKDVWFSEAELNKRGFAAVPMRDFFKAQGDMNFLHTDAKLYRQYMNFTDYKVLPKGLYFNVVGECKGKYCEVEIYTEGFQIYCFDVDRRGERGWLEIVDDSGLYLHDNYYPNFYDDGTCYFKFLKDTEISIHGPGGIDNFPPIKYTYRENDAFSGSCSGKECRVCFDDSYYCTHSAVFPALDENGKRVIDINDGKGVHIELWKTFPWIGYDGP